MAFLLGLITTFSEQERLDTIAKNHAKLVELGLESAADEVRQISAAIRRAGVGQT